MSCKTVSLNIKTDFDKESVDVLSYLPFDSFSTS